MRRFLLAMAAVAVGVVIGVLVAPHVLTPAGQQLVPTAGDLRSEDGVSRESERDPEALAEQSTAGDEEPTAEPTDEPTDEPTEEPTLSPAERADRRAGVQDREIPDSADGTLSVVSGEQDAPDPGAERVVTVRVEVEDGLAIDGETFAGFVMDTLNDERGWGHDGAVSFARTDGEPDFRVVLASPDQVDQMCAPLRTVGEYSCGRYGHAALNATRFAQATEEFLAEGSITGYRQYVITHEVGHLLGHQHQDCPGTGEVAPVMQQQTITLDGCVPNAWPAP
ncbi:DUF3152 domain-containing protein [Ruania zhangjianzhongii]|uniref:DUF3152 domain-containing protein n=1 Tax=Ruania zhangjianzhongii TaxID=2603206 RepID=UPI0011C9C229|nr:DUF3152 domain-containing protein [Ruania zhangjianzhongii]